MADYSLTALQLEILRVLWEEGEATVLEVQAKLQPRRPLAQSTVSTLLMRLAKKGVVAHRTEGRQYVYRALVDESAVRRSVVSEFSELADRLFHGDVVKLVNHLLSDEDVAPEDLRRVRAMVEQMEMDLRRRWEED